MVPEAGLEPARPLSQRILSPSCLPIPPHGHMECIQPNETLQYIQEKNATFIIQYI